MVIIEDKTGLKKNSLFGTEVVQTQDNIENFCVLLGYGVKASRHKNDRRDLIPLTEKFNKLIQSRLPLMEIPAERRNILYIR